LFREEASAKLLAGDYEGAKLLVEKSKDLEKILKSSASKAKITLMSILFLNFDKLTSEIVSRLD
jgi:hypothetical protein